MTDEQREQFEAWAKSRGIEVFLPDEKGDYYYRESNELRDAYMAGLTARDAEVAALREALTEVTEDLASEVIARYGPILTHPNTVRRFDRDMELVYRARKLLAGEGGETE